MPTRRSGDATRFKYLESTIVFFGHRLLLMVCSPAISSNADSNSDAVPSHGWKLANRRMLSATGSLSTTSAMASWRLSE